MLLLFCDSFEAVSLEKFSASFKGKRSFAECGYAMPVNKVERLCVMSDEKGMEANRCHGVGH